MSLEKRIRELENWVPRRRATKDMTDDELAELITGKRDTEADDLTDAEIEAIANKEER